MGVLITSIYHLLVNTVRDKLIILILFIYIDNYNNYYKDVYSVNIEKLTIMYA